jgi:serine/threonine protein kinase
VGVTLWEALAGKRAFIADNQPGLIAKVIKGLQQLPSDINPGLPKAIVDVCMRAVSMKPDDRPATAAAYAEEIEEAAKRAGVAIASTRQVVEFVSQHTDLWQTPFEVRESSGRIEPDAPVEVFSGDIDIVVDTEMGTAMTPPVTAVSRRRSLLLRVLLAASLIAGGFGAWIVGSWSANPADESGAGVVTAGSSAEMLVLAAPTSSSPVPAPSADASADASANRAAAAQSAAPPRRRSRRRRPVRRRPSGSTRDTTGFRPSGL